MKNKVLGKGLRALIPENTKLPEKHNKENKVRQIKEVDLDLIEPNEFQPRKTFNDSKLLELAQSIKNAGILQPLIVRQKKDSSDYELIAGERRLRAAKIAGFKTVPVIIKEIDNEEILSTALIENIQRSDLNVIEEAESYNKLIEEFNYTHEEISHKVSRSRASITNILRLLNLPDEIKDDLKKDKISMGHARALLSVQDKKKQLQLFKKIKKKNLSVRETEKLTKTKIKEKKEEEVETEIKISEVNPEQTRIEEQLREYLGTKVTIKNKENNQGQIIIEYYNLEDFDRILGFLKMDDSK